MLCKKNIIVIALITMLLISMIAFVAAKSLFTPKITSLKVPLPGLGEECHQGKCKGFLKCGTDNTCGGLAARCRNDNYCLSETCTPNHFCLQAVGGICSKDAQCVTGTCYESICIEQLPLPQLGEECSEQGECADNLQCGPDNTCGGPGAQCNQDSECVYSNCKYGTCGRSEANCLYDTMYLDEACLSGACARKDVNHEIGYTMIPNGTCLRPLEERCQDDRECASGNCDDYYGVCKPQPYCGDGICNGNERYADWQSYEECLEDCNPASPQHPNFDMPSPDFDALIVDIGVDTTPTIDVDEMISRMETILLWMSNNEISSSLSDPENLECMDYANEVKICEMCDFTPDTYGKVFAHFGKICKTSCHGSAAVFATLAWKAGIPFENLVITGKATANNDALSHFYTKLKVSTHGAEYWIIIDPTCVGYMVDSVTIDPLLGITCGANERYMPCTYKTPILSNYIDPIPDYCIDTDIADYNVPGPALPNYMDAGLLDDNCSESDGGINIQVIDTLLTIQNDRLMQYTDSCYHDNIKYFNYSANEYYCQDGVAFKQKYICDTDICSEGLPENMDAHCQAYTPVQLP